MIAGGLLSGLLLAALQPVAPTPPPTDLGLYREIVEAMQWTRCCGPFPSGLPDDLRRRVDATVPRLESRYGRDAVRREADAARQAFEARIPLYDAAALPTNPSLRRAARRQVRTWYAGHLAALEARLGMVAR